MLADPVATTPEDLPPLDLPPETPRQELEASLFPVLDEETQDELFQLALSDYQSAQNDRQEWEGRLAEWDEQYYGITTDKTYPWPGASNLYVPLTMLGIETLKPRLTEAVLGGPILVSPVEGTDSERAERVELFINWQRQTELKIDGLVTETAHLFLNPGLTIAKMTWDVKRRRRKFVRTFPVSVPQEEILASVLGGSVPNTTKQLPGLKWEGELPSTPSGGPPLKFTIEFSIEKEYVHVKVEREELTEKPKIALVSHLDFFAPFDGGSNIQELPWICERSYMSEQDLRRNVYLRVFEEAVVDELIRHQTPTGEESDQDAQGYRDQLSEVSGSEPDPETSVRAGDYEVLQFCRSWDIDDDGWDEEIIYWVTPQLPGKLLGWNYLDNVYAHGLRPYAVGRYHPVPFKFLPLSFPEIVRNIQEEINTIHNQRVDFNTITNLPWYFYRAGSTHSAGVYKIRPGEGIPIDNPQTDIFMPRWQSNPQFGANEESVDYQYFERLTGLTDLSLGRQPNRVGATRTATGVASLLNESGLRFKTAMHAFQQFWVDIFDQVLALDQQYLPPGKEFRVTGKLPEFVRLSSRTEIAGKYDVTLSATTETLNKQVQRDDAGEILQLIVNPMGLQLGLVGLKGIYRAYREVLRSRGKDPDLYLQPPSQEPIKSPEEELSMMVSGDDVEPAPGEDFQAHLAAHAAQSADPAVRAALGDAGLKRLAIHQAKTAQLAQVQQVAQMMAPKTPPGAPPMSQQAQNAQTGRQAGMGGVASSTGQPAPPAPAPATMAQSSGSGGY